VLPLTKQDYLTRQKMATPTADQQVMQKEFVHLGEEIQKLANSRQQLAIQLNENEGVLSELALLSSEAELFRSVGSALVRTEASDAKALIVGRVDMIKKELVKTEQIVQEKVSFCSNRKL
jgi:chaperonin cofactor prefoldin